MQLIRKIFSNFRGVLTELAIIVLTKEVALGVRECKSHWSRYAIPSIKNHSVYKFLQIFRNFLFISKEDRVQSIKPISFCGFFVDLYFPLNFSIWFQYQFKLSSPINDLNAGTITQKVIESPFL